LPGILRTAFTTLGVVLFASTEVFACYIGGFVRKVESLACFGRSVVGGFGIHDWNVNANPPDDVCSFTSPRQHHSGSDHRIITSPVSPSAAE